MSKIPTLFLAGQINYIFRRFISIRNVGKTDIPYCLFGATPRLFAAWHGYCVYLQRRAGLTPASRQLPHMAGPFSAAGSSVAGKPRSEGHEEVVIGQGLSEAPSLRTDQTAT
jgi:hypothetical protein